MLLKNDLIQWLFERSYFLFNSTYRKNLKNLLIALTHFHINRYAAFLIRKICCCIFLWFHKIINTLLTHVSKLKLRLLKFEVRKIQSFPNYVLLEMRFPPIQGKKFLDTVSFMSCQLKIVISSLVTVTETITFSSNFTVENFQINQKLNCNCDDKCRLTYLLKCKVCENNLQDKQWMHFNVRNQIQTAVVPLREEWVRYSSTGAHEFFTTCLCNFDRSSYLHLWRNYSETLRTGTTLDDKCTGFSRMCFADVVRQQAMGL